MKKRRTFTPEFKEAVVQRVQGSSSVAAVTRLFGLKISTVRKWVRQAKIDAGKGPPGALKTDERIELARLRRENEQLRRENELLMKAVGMVEMVP